MLVGRELQNAIGRDLGHEPASRFADRTEGDFVLAHVSFYRRRVSASRFDAIERYLSKNNLAINLAHPPELPVFPT
jgi:hypothetical protein